MTNDTESATVDYMGAKRDNPPPHGRPGDTWWPEGSPRLRMNDDHEWVLA